MHIFIRLAACVALCFLTSATAAAQTVPAEKLAEQAILRLKVGEPRLNVFEHVYIVDAIDSPSNLDDGNGLAQVDATPIEAVRRSEDGGLDGPVWARLRVMNAGSEPAQWRLDTMQGWGVLLDAYLLRGDRPPQRVLANNWADGGFDDRYPRTLRPASAPFDLAPGEAAEIWLDLAYGLTGHEDFWLRDEAQFEQARLSDLAFETLVFGFRLALAAGIFAFAAVLRSRLALYYGLFTALLTTFFLNTSGYTYAYLLNDSDNDALFYTLNGLAIMTVFTLMIQENIKAPKRYPRYNLVLLGSLGLGVAAAVITSWLTLIDLAVYSVLRAASLAAFVCVAVYGAWIGVRDRHPGARQFMLATLVLFGFVMFGLMGWPPFYLVDTEMVNEVQFVGFTADALLFASALVSRAIEMRRARDAATAAELKAVSERASIAEQLAVARDDHADAVDLAEARRRQLAATSHDLAQPLVSLQMSLKKMEGAEAVSEGISFLESVVRRNLSDTRPDAPPSREPENATETIFALDQTLRNVVLMFTDEAQAKGVALGHVPTSLRVICEPVALMRIAVNLVANAIQHSAGGRVLIGARRGADTVRLQVADNGAGMSPEQAERIFSPYVAGAKSRGEGLGLSVIKTLAESQGCSISVRSTPGAGSIFTVAGIARANAPPSLTPPSLPG